jgi:hypothetical protein
VSRKTTRHVVADYLTAANIPGVGKVYASPPKISRSMDALANVPAGTPSGAVVYVEIYHTSEVRIAVGGPTAGKKLVTHDLRLHLLARSTQLLAEDAMDDHDTLLEAILALLRADRTLASTTSPIFQNGEGDAGIVVDTGMPFETGSGTTNVWTSIDTQAVEFITA